MKRIVLGLDATPAMQPAIDWTERFAADVGAHVDAVHVVPRTLLMAISSVQANSDTYLKTMRSQLEHEVLPSLRAAGISADAHVERGDAAHELARYAHRTDADLIVIGGADHSALHDVAFGGTARRLEHYAHVPVVVVPLKRAAAHDRR